MRRWVAMWPHHAPALGTYVPSIPQIIRIRNCLIFVHQSGAVLQESTLIEDLKGALFESVGAFKSYISQEIYNFVAIPFDMSERDSLIGLEPSFYQFEPHFQSPAGSNLGSSGSP